MALFLRELAELSSKDTLRMCEAKIFSALGIFYSHYFFKALRRLNRDFLRPIIDQTCTNREPTTAFLKKDALSNKAKAVLPTMTEYNFECAKKKYVECNSQVAGFAMINI